MVEALKIKLERTVVEEVLRLKRIPYRIDEEQMDNPDVGVFIPYRGIDRKVGIEVTGYYSAYPKNPETPRQKKLLESGRAIATWIRTDNTDAFIRQIRQKIEKAKRYRKGFDAIWSLYYFDMIGVQCIHPLFFGRREWQQDFRQTNEELMESSFDSVLLYIWLTKSILEWHKGKGWQSS